jgi:enoyl-[acyl-carrier-protein] reductase (NADH)
MTYSSEKLQENIRILSETLQSALNAISYLISEDASNTTALAEKVAEIDELKSTLDSVDDVIGDSFTDVIELAKEVMEKASQAPTQPTEPAPVPPVLLDPTLPIGGEPSVTPLQF